MVREVDGELLVLDTVSDRIHRLNRTASAIWLTSDAAASPAEIAAVLAKTFDVGEDEALRDVTDTLERFRTLGLLAEEPGD